MSHPAGSVESQQLSRTTTVALHLAFIVSGMVTVLLGPIVPSLQLRFGVSDAQVGSLFVAQFAASSVGSLLSQRRSTFSVLGGIALLVAGVAALPFTTWVSAHLAVFTFGIGLGLVIPAINMLIARANPGKRAAAVNILNLCWGVGAAISPVIAAAVQQRLGLRGALLLISGICALILALCLVVDLPTAPGRAECGSPVRPSSVSPLVFYCAALFLYVGVETSIGGWTGAHMTASGFGPWVGWATAAFWTALIGGRGLASFLLKRIEESSLLTSSLLLALFGIAGLTIAHTIFGLLACTIASGLGLAPIFGLFLSALTEFAERHHIAVPGWLFACVGMGGAALPWIVGQIADWNGSLRHALWFPAAVVLVLLAMSRRGPETVAMDEA